MVECNCTSPEHGDAPIKTLNKYVRFSKALKNILGMCVFLISKIAKYTLYSYAVVRLFSQKRLNTFRN